MVSSARDHADKFTVAFGPEVQGWGSWEWIGSDLARELAGYFQTFCFQFPSCPDADVVVVVKHLPSIDWLEQVSAQASIIYCPVDSYGDAAEIDADALKLRRCSRILIHCERLRKYFQPYSHVAYLDHHVKYLSNRPPVRRREGSILWVGVRSNLPPLVEWVNEHDLPGELFILTNLENPKTIPRPCDLGFRAAKRIVIENWSPEMHVHRTSQARLALDIKGRDFRSCHKPPVKALDYIASGLPLAMNPESSPVEHLSRMGFQVASPTDWERWFSEDYWEDTQRFGAAIAELLSLRRIGNRFRQHIHEVLDEKRRCGRNAIRTMDRREPSGSQDQNCLSASTVPNVQNI